MNACFFGCFEGAEGVIPTDCVAVGNSSVLCIHPKQAEAKNKQHSHGEIVHAMKLKMG
jgi:hypothetical protein